MAQQAGSFSQQAEAQTSGARTVTAEAMGAMAKEASRARRATAFIEDNVVHEVGGVNGESLNPRAAGRGTRLACPWRRWRTSGPLMPT